MAAKKGSTSKEHVSIPVALRNEKEAPLPMGFAETIEADLTGAGKYAVPRRVAMAMLERTWPELKAGALGDRATAEAFANAAEDIGIAVKHYESLVQWLRVAEVRLLLAVGTRADCEELYRAVRDDRGEAGARCS